MRRVIVWFFLIASMVFAFDDNYAHASFDLLIALAAAFKADQKF